MGNTGAMRAIKPPTTIDVMVMRIVTRFTTIEEFVSAFRKFCGEGTCFIPSAQAKRVGIETGFSIRLADGTPMLRGLCVVLDSWATSDNPYDRPGVRLGLRSLTAESKPVFQRLLLAGVAAKPELLDEHSRATVEMAPLFPEERTPHAELILPANPLSAMSDESLQAFVDCTLFEDAIPEAIHSREPGMDDATGRIDDDRNDPNTRRIETTTRIKTPEPIGTSLERALAAAASATVRLDGGTQRIERLESPQERARDLADEHADSAFGPMLAKAAERIEPVADHTAPTRMPPEMMDAATAITSDQAIAAAPGALVPIGPAYIEVAAPVVTAPVADSGASASMPRMTILGIAPLVHPAPRARVAMPALTDPAAPAAQAWPFPAPPTPEAADSTTDMMLRPPSRMGLWWRVTTAIRGWYKRLVWARRRRAALRS